MRILIFITLLIILHLSDCYLSSGYILPKARESVLNLSMDSLNQTLHPLNQNHFDRVQKMKPINQDTVYTITYPDTKFNILN